MSSKEKVSKEEVTNEKVVPKRNWDPRINELHPDREIPEDLDESETLEECIKECDGEEDITVCGSNKMTYPNDCLFYCNNKYLYKNKMQIIFFGRCRDRPTGNAIIRFFKRNMKNERDYSDRL